MTCQQCPDGQIQSSDGFGCVACDATCQSCSASKSFRIDTDQYGAPLIQNGIQTSLCVTCQQTSSILADNTCVSCKPFIFAQSSTDSISSISCNQAFSYSAGFLLYGTIPGYDYTTTFGTDTVTSSYLSSNLQGVYLTCQNANRRNVTSCQALANMCVLKLYSLVTSTSSNSDPCTLFNAIVSPTSQQTLAFWPDNLPWLFYPQTLAVYQSSYDLTGIGNGQYLNLQYETRYGFSVSSFF